LSGDEVEEAIAGPAWASGLVIERGLAERISNDLSNQPGALPLLQYALTELFEHRNNGQLSLETYRTIGGVTGALARRAEELYTGFDGFGKESARQLFMRLVALAMIHLLTAHRYRPQGKKHIFMIPARVKLYQDRKLVLKYRTTLGIMIMRNFMNFLKPILLAWHGIPLMMDLFYWVVFCIKRMPFEKILMQASIYSSDHTLLQRMHLSLITAVPIVRLLDMTGIWV